MGRFRAPMSPRLMNNCHHPALSSTLPYLQPPLYFRSVEEEAFLGARKFSSIEKDYSD